jgi:hypothetical protein
MSDTEILTLSRMNFSVEKNRRGKLKDPDLGCIPGIGRSFQTQKYE